MVLYRVAVLDVSMAHWRPSAMAHIVENVRLVECRSFVRRFGRGIVVKYCVGDLSFVKISREFARLTNFNEILIKQGVQILEIFCRSWHINL